MAFSAYVHWPDAPLTDRLVRNALGDLNPTYVDAQPKQTKLLQWSAYDSLDHERGLLDPKNVLSSSYTFRKALIRKHFLSHITHAYSTKHPHSILKTAIPETYELELTFADELDEMWLDDLYELGNKLESGDSWWILKPGMADRGMGIRLFNSKEQLQEIFGDFESDDEDEDDENDTAARGSSTAVVTSQLRHFVVQVPRFLPATTRANPRCQAYLPNPLLFDPHEVLLDGRLKEEPLTGHKFHLRVYCVASGALKVYICTRILALFAPAPYIEPQAKGGEEINLVPHLTNTCLHTEQGEAHVRLFDELAGRRVMSGDSRVFTKEDISDIVGQLSDILADTFKAAVDSPVHFQPVPNAFELYGVDFLLSDSGSDSEHGRFHAQLLEINAEPAIEMTGPRLTWVLEDLFKSIACTCVEPFFTAGFAQEDWPVGETRYQLKKCLDIETRGWD
ncbi:hypothetical protein NMY22_g2616 [Coprinellus aureogranulatus]|nr:hypothetical protein NMY22_g2616 [Coprinellus aureogranulatus]